MREIQPLSELVVVATAIGLAIGELALRLLPAPAEPEPPVRAREPVRLPRPAPARVPGTFRVMVIGDSFTFGHGVHGYEAYPAVLERLLPELAPDAPPLEVLNAGHKGWNTEELARALGGWLQSYDPDLVILGWCLNDPEATDHQLRDRLNAALSRRRPEGEVVAALYARSALFRTVFERLENERQRDAFDAYYRSLYEEDTPGWRAAVGALRAIRDELEARSVPLVVVIWPLFNSQLDERYPYRELHRKIGSTLDELGIPALDLLPALEPYDGRLLSLVPFADAHPSALAHRLGAEELARYLAQHLIVVPAVDGERLELLIGRTAVAGPASAP